MARTFVNVDLRDRRAISRFTSAMLKLGFVQTLVGRKKHQPLQLPRGVYLLERGGTQEALELARQAVRTTNVQAHILCVPASGDVRFGNLAPSAR
ncbi:MAG TPA: hypothetical protein VK427_16765 [Kofleriaceae bacterium]|nr:hypothetical protein [Kofleriaceae bacterium]